jgi:hypothetical protein
MWACMDEGHKPTKMVCVPWLPCRSYNRHIKQCLNVHPGHFISC